MTNPVPVFDGHNDIVLKIDAAGPAREPALAAWRRRRPPRPAAHADVRLRGRVLRGLHPLARDAGPCRALPAHDGQPALRHAPAGPDRPPRGPAGRAGMLGHLLWMERASEGRFRWCRTAAEIRAAMAAGVVAGVIHFEGAEPIGPDLDALHLFHAMGLRSARPGVEPPDHLRPRRPVPLSVHRRHRARADRPREGPGPRMQRPADHDRPFPPERGRVLGRGQALRRPPCRHPFQRPCRDCLQPQPDGPPAASASARSAAWSA